MHFMKQDVKQLDVNTMTSFKHIAETFVATWDDTKATLATKEDLTGLEGRIKDDIAALKDDISALKATQDEHGQMLRELISRLPKSPG